MPKSRFKRLNNTLSGVRGQMKIVFFLVFIASFLIQCDSPSWNKADKNGAKSISATGDEKAIALAKRIEDASGGKENWDKVHYISFDYFGSRYWFWDKFKNRYRVESERRKFRIAGSIDGIETHLWLKGVEVTDADSMLKYKDYAYKAWINDMYWLILPFKLLDPGVYLDYVGECQFDSTHHATCFDMTFQNVGVTPENKYRIYVDTLMNNIIFWDHFQNKNDSLPSLSNPWTDYKQYGNIRLAGGRGDTRGLESIELYDHLPDQVFTDISKSYKELLKK